MNMDIWDKVKHPPESALKPITGGRLKGMTDIKPQWRYQVMTEIFGPCGIGWKFDIVNTSVFEGNDGTRVASVLVHLFIKQDVWSDPIPGVGGSMLVAKESSGLYTSDEAFKMATTDALSTAMKVLGVGADIYNGLFDGSKYKTPTVTIDQKVDMELVDRAVAYYKNLIDSPDDGEEVRREAKEKWNKLSMTNQKAVHERMGNEKAPNSDRLYRTLLNDYTK